MNSLDVNYLNAERTLGVAWERSRPDEQETEQLDQHLGS